MNTFMNKLKAEVQSVKVDIKEKPENVFVGGSIGAVVGVATLKIAILPKIVLGTVIIAAAYGAYKVIKSKQ